MSQILHHDPCDRRVPPGHARLVLAFCFLLIGTIIPAEARIFVRIEGIPGESREVAHEDWIDVLTLGTSSGAGVTSEALAKQALLTLIKPIDRASPFLLEGHLKQTVFPELLVEVTRDGLLESCYRLRGVQIVKHRLMTTQVAPELIEEYQVRFDVGEWHDFQNDANGGAAHVGTTWNFATNEGGILDGHEFTGPAFAPIRPAEVKPGEVFQVVIDLIDPDNLPDRLKFNVNPPESGRVKLLGVTGTGLRRTLSLEAGQLENGADELLLSVSDGTRSTTQRLPILVAGDRTAYEAYLEGFFANQFPQEPGIMRPLRDPDGDGMSNLMEFFLGTNPALPTPRQQAFTMTREPREDGTEVRLRYYRRVDQPGLSASFEGSSNANDWITLGPRSNPPLEFKQLSEPVNGYAPMEARVWVKEEPDRFFLRLSVRGSL